MALEILLLATVSFSATLRPCGAAPQLLRIAGSSTVYPVTVLWAGTLSQNYSFVDNSGSADVCTSADGIPNSTLCEGGSSEGAARVCAPRDDPSHVDIGEMSRDWKPTEAIRLDDGYTLECKHSGIRVTQMVVGKDGVAVVAAKNGPAHRCLLALGGLTLAQLRWMFSSWDNRTLADDIDGGVNLASVAPNDNHNGIKDWNDLSPACDVEPINTYGDGLRSGTYSFFSEVVLCKNCFKRRDGHTPEEILSCPPAENDALERLSSQADIDDYVARVRRPNCYMHTEDYAKMFKWVVSDTKSIAYFGYAHYAAHATELAVSPIADDRVNGAGDTTDAMITPTSATITDGSYSVLRRPLFMNVDNAAWPLVKHFMSFGYSAAGQAFVEQAGYVSVNSAVAAKMLQRVAEGGNPTADYTPVALTSCPVGHQLLTATYLNQFGRAKTNYSCTPCEEGRFKPTTAPTDCTACAEGSFQASTGQSECIFTAPGEYAGRSAVNSTRCPKNTAQPMPGQAACALCEAGFVTQDVGATRCQHCDMGRYRTANDTDCVPCPLGMTTEFRAASLPADCACAPGTYQESGPAATGRCLPCPKGMSCGFGSRFDNFAAAPAQQGQLPAPMLKEHYWSDPSDPTSVYLCRMEDRGCPGGRPGMCRGGKSGRVCFTCPNGLVWSGHQCAQCHQLMGLLSVLLPIAILILIIGTYYLANSQVRASISATGALTLAFGQLLSIAQILAMFKDLNIEWPEHLRETFRSLSVSTGGSRALSYECFVGPTAIAKYLFRCSLPLNLLLACAVLHVLSWVVARLSRSRVPAWEVDKTINTAAQILQALFIGLAAIIVVPLQCYGHPNGRSSLSQFPQVLCWEGGEHATLVALAAAVTVVFLIPFMAYCIYGTLKIVKHDACDPAYARSLVRYRFLLFRFREDIWWWGNVFMARQLLLAFASSLPASTPHAQCIFIASILSLYLFMQAYYWPWKVPAFNILDSMISLHLIVIITVATALLELANDPTSYATFLLVLIVALLSSSTLLSCYALCTSYWTKEVDECDEDVKAEIENIAKIFHELSCDVAEQGLADAVTTVVEMSYYDRQILERCTSVYHACNQTTRQRAKSRGHRPASPRLAGLGRRRGSNGSCSSNATQASEDQPEGRRESTSNSPASAAAPVSSSGCAAVTVAATAGGTAVVAAAEGDEASMFSI